MDLTRPKFIPTHPNVVELDRIGDEIAELSRISTPRRRGCSI